MTSPEETYIVTGATGGIGRAITEGLGRLHPEATIILACRNLDKARSLAAGRENLRPMYLDLESFDSVRRFARDVHESGCRVKALFNNAGTMPGDVRITSDGYESAMQTNFLSPMLLTELLADLVVSGGAVVFTTSVTRKIASFRHDWAGYAVDHHGRFTTYGLSKKMITAYCAMLAERLAQRGIRANCSDPGIVDSGMIAMGNPLIDSLSDKIFRPLIYTPEQGAAPALRAMDSGSSAVVFTLKHERPIPKSYSPDRVRGIISAALDKIL